MRLKEEKWRLRNIEQEFSFQEKHVQKLLQVLKNLGVEFSNFSKNVLTQKNVNSIF